MLEAWCVLHPDNASAWLNRGYCLIRLGRFAQALTVLERSLELDPSSDTAQGWKRKALAEVARSQRDLASSPAAKTAAEDEIRGPAAATHVVLPAAGAVARRQRGERMAPVMRVLHVLTRNLGLKVAAIAVLVILGLLAVMIPRTPKSEEAVFHHTLYQQAAILVRDRNLRLQRGMVLSFQGESVVGPGECIGSDFEQYLELALHVEDLRSPPSDPRARAESTAFREGYARAIECLGGFSDPRVVEPIVRRVSEGMNPYRFEDLLSVMVRVGARGGRRINRALGDPSAAVRHLAALTLIHSGDRNSAAALVRALEGDDFRMVEAGSYVLIELIVGGAIPEPLAFPTILRLSRSIEPRTRRNTVRALILFEDAGPSRRLLEEALADSDAEVALVARKVRDSLRDRRIHELLGFGVVGRE